MQHRLAWPMAGKAGMLAPKELVLHKQVAQIFREHCLPDWQHTHFPGGEQLTARVAAKLKEMGKMPGWPDFILIDPTGRVRFLELKRKGMRTKPGSPQALFREWCIERGVPYAVAWSLDDVCMILDEWRCLRIKFAPD